MSVERSLVELVALQPQSRLGEQGGSSRPCSCGRTGRSSSAGGGIPREPPVRFQPICQINDRVQRDHLVGGQYRRIREVRGSSIRLHAPT